MQGPIFTRGFFIFSRTNPFTFLILCLLFDWLQELFYLLADTEHETVEQGGVVTVSSLAVELQAGRTGFWFCIYKFVNNSKHLQTTRIVNTSVKMLNKTTQAEARKFEEI